MTVDQLHWLPKEVRARIAARLGPGAVEQRVDQDYYPNPHGDFEPYSLAKPGPRGHVALETHDRRAPMNAQELISALSTATKHDELVGLCVLADQAAASAPPLEAHRLSLARTAAHHKG
jgi:hypothetical protein